MKKIKAIMFLGLVVALLVIGFSPISEAASGPMSRFSTS